MKFDAVWNRLCIFLALFIMQVSSQQNWCNYSAAHTMCRFTGPGASCFAPVNSGVDGNVARYIVALHNIRRARVASGAETRGAPGPQPSAANMSQLRWNSDLALVAQRWADQCTFASDSVRNASLTPGDNSSTPAVVYVGQNVYAYLDSNANVAPISSNPQPAYWEQAINSWYDEVRFFDSRTVGSYVYQANVGHYTQFVWGATTDIGCGFTRWRYDSNRIGRMCVCNYGVGGNRAGTPVYISTTAIPCSSCANATTTGCVGSLCATPRIPGSSV